MPTATVHAWNDTGWRHDGAHARLIAFDLDNTLAVSKQPMKPDMTVRIEALTELMPVAIVTGGGRELVISQVLDVLGPRADLSNLHVMPAGIELLPLARGRMASGIREDAVGQDRDAAILSLTRRARELGMWPEHPWGAYRGSWQPDHVLGSGAVRADRGEAPLGSRRHQKRRLVAAVAGDLGHLRVRAGGYECRCERRKHRQGVRPARIGGTARHRHW